METRKHCTQEEENKLGSAVLWLLAFPGGEASPKFQCITLGQETYRIESNLRKGVGGNEAYKPTVRQPGLEPETPRSPSPATDLTTGPRPLLSGVSR